MANDILIEEPAVWRAPTNQEIAMQMRKRISLFLLSFTLAAANAALAYPEYRVTIVGPANSYAYDINKAGVVVGAYPVAFNVYHAFLNRGSGMVDLGTLGGASSQAVAINDKGEVLGNWTPLTGPSRGFIYYHGKLRDLKPIPGRATGFTDINNAGYITAVGTIPNSSQGSHAFLRAPNGTFRDIGNLPSDNPLTTAQRLNNCNQITGASGPLTFPDQPLRAYIWSKGVIRDLGDLGADPNGGLAINDRGQITGYASVPTGFRNQTAFLYSNGRMIDIDGRPATEDRFSAGTGINNLGHIVGTSNHLSGFIYRGRRMESLNALIDPKLGWNIASPQAINDAGQIAANAVRKGVQYAVRLDLIRPHLETTPAPAPEDEAGSTGQSLSPEQAAAEAKAEAEAAAKEVAKPLGQ
jgi:probable HAF family extracellular repeat protein